jgi:putative ABC transport system permease protein
MIVRAACALLAAGVIVGAGLAVLAARSATTLLYELQPSDPATLLAAAAALGTVTIAASSIPALRASRLEPTRALRED